MSGTTMQPPPRKVKPSVALKNTHTDQVSKLQAKHQQECDLLEDIRTFFLRKSALEKEYAQGLQKVTSQLLRRDFQAQPDLLSEDGREHKTVCAVWRSILEESDRLAKVRLQAAEVYAEKAAEPLKPTKVAKMQCYKKVSPQLNTIQAEVAQCVLDLVKAQKMYTTDEGLAHEARQKSSEAEDKLKRKSTGIFQSLASLQKTCAKLRSRTETSEMKETASRNDYLLCLSAANAHHIRYYSTDLPEIMKTLDCDFYEKIQETLTVAGQTAADLAEAENSSFQNIAGEAAKICRQFSHQCYLFQNPVFTNLVQYQFEPCHDDTCNKVSGDHNMGPELEKEARKWSTKVAKETRAIRDYFRQMSVIQNMKAGDRASESGSQETTPVDPEVKLEELRQNVRKAETSKLKAEARLEALRSGGVNVEEWMNQAQMESLAAEESGLARTPSQLSLRTESSGGQSTDDHEPTYTHYDDDDDDFIDDTFNTTPGLSRSGRAYPIYCKALYDFEASNYDEMSIKAEEELELIADGDGDGWVKAKNGLGQEGYIPETYVDLGGLSDVPAPLGVEAMNTFNESVSQTTTAAAENTTAKAKTAATTSGTPDIQSPTSVDLQQDTTSSYSSGDLEVQQATEVMDVETPVRITTQGPTDISWARALYDYEGQTEEELSFMEGAVIKILRKDDNGVDDGFWEGECNGVSGVFPSLVVEEIADPATPHDPISPGLTGMQDFSIPPPVLVTLPTPDAEPPPPPPMANGEDSGSAGESTTPTADQIYKRVRFTSDQDMCLRGTSSHHQDQQLHNHHHHHHQHQLQRQQQQDEEDFLDNKSRSPGWSHSNSIEVPPTRVTPAPSPILRHKSLPNRLDMMNTREDLHDVNTESENRYLQQQQKPQSEQFLHYQQQQLQQQETQLLHQRPRVRANTQLSGPPQGLKLSPRRAMSSVQSPSPAVIMTSANKSQHSPLSSHFGVPQQQSVHSPQRSLPLQLSNTDRSLALGFDPQSPARSPVKDFPGSVSIQQRADPSLSPQQQLLQYVQSQMLKQKQQQQYQQSQYYQSHPEVSKPAGSRTMQQHNHHNSQQSYNKQQQSSHSQHFQREQQQSFLPSSPEHKQRSPSFQARTPPSSQYNKKRTDKLPLCLHEDTTDDDWEEGEESLV